ncbi:MAG TPA: type II toxin-antitoxin system HicB family antitoxin [Thermoleophilaceae bacterium]|nr:type II toxin-antitoxin system HicB family antitoxin [Thermoleophilaceae bacterium]
MRARTRYAVLIDEARSGFSAYSPDLPGCVAAAHTPEENEQLTHEATELQLEGSVQGRPVPDPATWAV